MGKRIERDRSRTIWSRTIENEKSRMKNPVPLDLGLDQQKFKKSRTHSDRMVRGPSGLWIPGANIMMWIKTVNWWWEILEIRFLHLPCPCPGHLFNCFQQIQLLFRSPNIAKKNILLFLKNLTKFQFDQNDIIKFYSKLCMQIMTHSHLGAWKLEFHYSVYSLNFQRPNGIRPWNILTNDFE